MRKRTTNEKGFTLIEVIVTLILVGITAVLAGLWIVNVANGYIFAKMNASTVQKAQLAMTRLAKEFGAIQLVSAATGGEITYTRVDEVLPDTTTTKTHTIKVVGDDLQITGNTLTDRVSGFTLSYCDATDSTNCPAAWSSSSRIIEVSLTLTGADNTPSTFTKRVTPRNLQ